MFSILSSNLIASGGKPSIKCIECVVTTTCNFNFKVVAIKKSLNLYIASGCKEISGSSIKTNELLSADVILSTNKINLDSPDPAKASEYSKPFFFNKIVSAGLIMQSFFCKLVYKECLIIRIYSYSSSIILEISFTTSSERSLSSIRRFRPL